jgi:hypothetical protein
MEHIYWYYRLQTKVWMRRHRVDSWCLWTEAELRLLWGDR